MKLFLDANIIIYLVEGDPALSGRIRKELRTQHSGHSALATSVLSRLECRVKPLRKQDAKLLDEFDVVLGQMDLLPVTLAAIETATRLRADHNFKAFDAIQLATAIETQCDRFVTADAKLTRVTDIPVVLINPS